MAHKFKKEAQTEIITKSELADLIDDQEMEEEDEILSVFESRKSKKSYKNITDQPNYQYH